MAVEGSAGIAGGAGIDRLTKQLFKFMIANDTSPKVNVRLNRIKIISWALKILLLLFFLFFGFGRVPFARKTPDGFWEVVFGTYTTFSDAPLVAKLIVGLGISMVLAAIVTGYQLLNLYQKGIIFSAKNVQLLGRIGFLAFGYGLLGAVGPSLIATWDNWVNESGLMAHSILWGIIASLSSPWIIGGLFLVVISRIMDEGRKIQEEQELTV
jgi:MFS family permease